MDEQPRTVTVTRTRDDYFAFCNAAARGLGNVRIYYYVALIVLVILYINAMEIAVRNHALPDWLLRSKYLIAIFSIIIIVGMQRVLRKCFMPAFKREYLNDNQLFLRKKQSTFDERGFRETSDTGDSYCTWQGVDRIEKTKDLLLVYVDKMSAYCIPLRNFESPAAAEAFYLDMLRCWKAANERS